MNSKTFMSIFLALSVLLSTAVILIAQGPPPLPPGQRFPEPLIVEQAAPPVIVGGKTADSLSDEEKKQFLQEKIRTIFQEEGEVELLRVAPGYSLTITFEEPVASVIMGDTAVAKTDLLNNRTMVLSALVREGDTSMQVFFPGNRIRVYHVFVAENFLQGETAIKVAGFQDEGDASAKKVSVGMTPSGNLDIRTITQIVRNYDALVGERAIDSRTVRRVPIFKTSNITHFTTFYIYRFSTGPAAITFSYKNPYPHPVRYDESRLRLAIGNVRYIPDYVSFNQNVIPPGGNTTGFAVIASPAFSFEQPFELVWK